MISPLHALEMRQVPEKLARRSEDGSVTWNTFSLNFEGNIRCFGIEEELADPSENMKSMVHVEVPVTRHDVHTRALALSGKHEPGSFNLLELIITTGLLKCAQHPTHVSIKLGS